MCSCSHKGPAVAGTYCNDHLQSFSVLTAHAAASGISLEHFACSYIHIASTHKRGIKLTIRSLGSESGWQMHDGFLNLVNLWQDPNAWIASIPSPFVEASLHSAIAFMLALRRRNPLIPFQSMFRTAIYLSPHSTPVNLHYLTMISVLYSL